MKRIAVRSYEDALRTIGVIGSFERSAASLRVNGSCVIVGPHHALTAQHVFDLARSSGKPPMFMAPEFGFDAQSRLNMTHRPIVRSLQLVGRDLCLVTLDTPLMRTTTLHYDLAAAKLASTPPRLGDALDVYGCPPAPSQVQERSKQEIAFPGVHHLRCHACEVDEGAIRLTMVSFPGASGAPVFNDAGELVAINCQACTRDNKGAPTGWGSSRCARTDDVVRTIHDALATP